MQESFTIETRKRKLGKDLDQLKDWLRVASEVGLFDESLTEETKQIYEAVAIASGLLAKQTPTHDDVATAEAKYFHALALFDQARNRRGRLWRMNNEWGVFHQLANILSALLATLFLEHFGMLWNNSIPVWACFCGVGGAALRSTYWPIYQADERQLRRVWVIGSLAGGFIGMLLAGALYAAIRAGLLVFSQNSAGPSPYATGLICMFAGYNWEWALGKLNTAVTKTETPPAKNE